MRVIAELGILLMLASVSSAQTPGRSAAEIQSVKVAGSGGKVTIAVTLTSPVTPAVITANNPDRLVVDFPNTTAAARQRHIAVNKSGVTQVRFGLNSADPLVTRVVIDLDAAHQYEIATAGNTITLTVLPNATASEGERHSGAVPAENAPAIAKLWPFRRQETPGAQSNATARMNFSPRGKEASNVTAEASAPVEGKSVREGPRNTFRVKYVAEGAAYLDGGRSSGLAEGMRLVVRDPSPSSAATKPGPVVAVLKVVSVADSSAVTDIRAAGRDLKSGDWAYLSAEDDAERALAAAAAPALPLTSVPPRKAKLRPPEPLPEDTRIRARVGLDYSGISSNGSTIGNSSQIGLSFRTDMTRIAGTYWNLQGYMRQRFTKNSQPNEDTLDDYLDRTYTLQLYYDNPKSKWVAGFGRLYLPWAVSLDTIDGGYVGRKVASGVTAGVFLGSTPDPASWHYSPNQQIAGSFINFEGGSYDDFHYTSTAGVALSMLKWQLDRPYLFLENGASYEKYISVYHSFILDSPQGVSTGGIKPGTGISRSYLTVHIQPHERISFDIYHNYFRDVPTAATALIGTGLVDKLLYQGINAGVRVEPVKHFIVYTTIGQSDKTGDVRRSLNQMYGLTWTEIWRTGIRGDIHYSKFDSSFARGDYRVLSLSRHLGDRMMWDFEVGNQNLNSAFTINTRSIFVDTSFDTNLGRHTFLQSGYTIQRGDALNYNQWYMSLGYRFDVKGPVK